MLNRSARLIATISTVAAVASGLIGCTKADPAKNSTPPISTPGQTPSPSPPPDITASQRYGPVSLVCAALDLSPLQAIADIETGDQTGNLEWLVGEDRLLNSCVLTPLTDSDPRDLSITVRLMSNRATAESEAAPLPESLGSLTDVSTADYAGTVHTESNFPKDDGTYTMRITLQDANMVIDVAISVRPDDEDKITRPLIETMATLFTALRQ